MFYIVSHAPGKRKAVASIYDAYALLGHKCVFFSGKYAGRKVPWYWLKYQAKESKAAILPIHQPCPLYPDQLTEAQLNVYVEREFNRGPKVVSRISSSQKPKNVSNSNHEKGGNQQGTLFSTSNESDKNPPVDKAKATRGWNGLYSADKRQPDD